MRGEAMSLFDSAMVPAPSFGPLGERLADAAVGGEVEVREDPDGLQPRRRQPLEEGVVRRQQVRVVHRRLVPGDVRRVAAGEDRRERARRVGRLRPGAAEVGARAWPARRASASASVPGGAAVAGDAQAIAAEGVDGDDQDVALERPPAGAAVAGGAGVAPPPAAPAVGGVGLGARRGSATATASPPSQFWSTPSPGTSSAPG